MVKYRGINHLAMITADMDATVRFWRDLLGMRLVAGLGKPGYRHYFFEIDENDLIAFFEWPGAEPIIEIDHGFPKKGPLVFDHVAIGVAQEDDLWELRDCLEAAGFWVSEPMDHGFIHSIYSFDPNGIPIEFSHMRRALDIRAEPRMRDKRPCDEAMKGPEPQANAWPCPAAPTPLDQRAVYPGEGRVLADPDLVNTWDKD